MLFAAVVWSIWNCRNKIVFDGKNFDGSQLWDLIMHRLGFWCKAKWPKSWISMHNFISAPNLFMPRLQQRFNGVAALNVLHQAAINSFTYFVDGSVRGNPGVAGVGGVLKDKDGLVIHSFSKFIGFCSPILAEILAIQEALISFSLKPFSMNASLVIVTDCINDRDWFCSVSLAPSCFKEIISKCLSDYRGFQWCVQFTPRELNGEADSLARNGVALQT